jgi:hypothetical protein
MTNLMLPFAELADHTDDAPPGLDACIPRHQMRAVRSIQQCDLPETGPQSADDILLALHNALVNDTRGDHDLFKQGQTLDSLFHRLVLSATTPRPDRDDLHKNDPHYVDERRALLALQAQSQYCRTVMIRKRLRDEEIFLADRNEGY